MAEAGLIDVNDCRGIRGYRPRFDRLVLIEDLQADDMHRRRVENAHYIRCNGKSKPDKTTQIMTNPSRHCVVSAETPRMNPPDHRRR